MRLRYHAFANAFFDELAKPGMDVRQATINAGRRMDWRLGANGAFVGHPMTERQILKKAKGIMERPDWIENMRDLYEVAGGFSPVEGIRTMVDHIRGNIEVERVHINKEGEETRYMEKLPPSLDALKTYYAQTVPKPTKHVQVDTRMMVAHRMTGSEPPKMRARVLKDVTPELPGES